MLPSGLRSFPQRKRGKIRSEASADERTAMWTAAPYAAARSYRIMKVLCR